MGRIVMKVGGAIVQLLAAHMAKGEMRHMRVELHEVSGTHPGDHLLPFEWPKDARPTMGGWDPDRYEHTFCWSSEEIGDHRYVEAQMTFYRPEELPPSPLVDRLRENIQTLDLLRDGEQDDLGSMLTSIMANITEAVIALERPPAALLVMPKPYDSVKEMETSPALAGLGDCQGPAAKKLREGGDDEGP